MPATSYRLTLPQHIVRIALALVALVGVFLWVGPDFTPEKGETIEDSFNPPKSVQEEYVMRDIVADVHLTIDENGYSKIITTETIDAVFRPEKGSRGIVRYLRDDFDEHETNPVVTSVTDIDGSELDYELGRDGHYVTVSIEGSTVRSGDVFYVITYEQSQVTTDERAEPSEDDKPGEYLGDQFEWNTWSYWKQPAAAMTINLTIDDDLKDAMVGEPEFIGVSGILGDTTDFDRQDDGSWQSRIEGTLVPASFIGSRVQFEPDTFTASERSEIFWLWLVLPYVPIFFAVPFFVLSLLSRRTRWADAQGTGIVIAQYEGYPGINLLQAGAVMRMKRTSVAAQLVDFAVRGKVRMRDLPPGPGNALGSKGTGYVFELVTAEGLDAEEQGLMRTVFGYALTPGTVVQLVNSATPLRVSLSLAGARTRKRTIELGLRRIPATMGRVILVWGPIAAAALQAGFVRQVRTSLTDEQALPIILVSIAAFAMAIAAYFIARSAFPLTRFGAEVKEHLLGVREYIELAEAARLRYLQSASGAPRDEQSLIDLDEKMLPYAILFGLENSWSTHLAINYKMAGVGIEPPAWWTSLGADR